jgi:hypothetical protein
LKYGKELNKGKTMEKTSRGKEHFFSVLASLIRITDFILAGGGVFKNVVWIILAAVAGTVIGYHRHITALGGFLFIVGVFITRFVVEATLVGLSLWVGRHLPVTAMMESEPDHSVRPYRFGTAWAILNLGACPRIELNGVGA